MIHIFPLSFLKGRRSTLLQSIIINSGILVSLETDLLWNFDGVYRRWNVFCVNRWHSNRYYTRSPGTAKRRNTNLRLLTWTTGILVSLETDLLWNFDGVYRRWNAFCVNRWHSNRYYTINQGTAKRRNTNLRLLMWTTGILVSLETDLLWNFDGVYRRWNAFCVNRWHSNRYYTINQGTAKRRNTNLRLLTWTTGILFSLGTDFLWNFGGVYRRWTYFA